MPLSGLQDPERFPLFKLPFCAATPSLFESPSFGAGEGERDGMYQDLRVKLRKGPEMARVFGSTSDGLLFSLVVGLLAGLVTLCLSVTAILEMAILGSCPKLSIFVTGRLSETDLGRLGFDLETPCCTLFSNVVRTSSERFLLIPEPSSLALEVCDG